MAAVLSTMATGIATTGVTSRQSAGQQVSRDGEATEECKFALAEARGLVAARFVIHIVAIMLQVSRKKQAFSERENRTLPFQPIYPRRKGNPCGLDSLLKG
jgi:hypothetical protein